MSSEIAIRVESLSKKYPLRQSQTDENGNSVHELWALKDVSFEVKKGESVGIIGHNGSGKSTLLKILAGVTKPTTGKVEIHGRVASILDIGAGFHSELSGRENVFLSGQTLMGFSRKEVEQKFDEIVAFSGIEQFIDEPVKNYSKGMYLRLAFSIMAHLDFEVYLFDEVLSVGDAEFVLKTKKKFKELLESEKTMLFVSHNLPELENQDMYILLRKGSVKQYNTNNEVLSNYVEEIWTSEGLKIINTKTQISDFSKYSNSEELQMRDIQLFQEDYNGVFTTDRPLSIQICFEKKKSINTLDTIIRVLDTQNGVIISSAPFISKSFSNDEEKGIYEYIFTIPANVLNAKIYVVDIIFVKNLLSFSNDAELRKHKNEPAQANVVLRLDRVLIFKTTFNNEHIGNLKQVNAVAGITPAFSWMLRKS